MCYGLPRESPIQQAMGLQCMHPCPNMCFMLHVQPVTISVAWLKHGYPSPSVDAVYLVWS